MCSFQQLFSDSNGYVIRCNECRHYQVLFNRTILSFDEAEYQKFLQVISCYKKDVEMNGEEREIVLPTPRQGVYLLVSRQQLSQLHDMAEEADTEQKALSMMHMFQE